MQKVNSITLNDGWSYFFTDNARASFNNVDLNALPWIPLPKLSDWMITASVHFGADWFRRTLVVDAQVMSSETLLKIDKVPDKVTVFFNGYNVGIAKGRHSFTADISTILQTGANELVLKLVCDHCTNGGRFDNVHLQSTDHAAFAQTH